MFTALFAAAVIVRLNKATTNEKQVSDFYIASLSLWTNVYPLVFTALIKAIIGYMMAFVSVVLNSSLVRVAAIVQKDAPPGNAMLTPVINGAFIIGFWANDIIDTSIVVEHAGA